MSDYTPTTKTVLAYIRGNAVLAGATADEAQEAAVGWLAEVERAAAEKAWDEGRESVAHDLMQPVQSDGTKPASVNPYRAAEIREGKNE